MVVPGTVKGRYSHWPPGCSSVRSTANVCVGVNGLPPTGPLQNSIVADVHTPSTKTKNQQPLVVVVVYGVTFMATFVKVCVVPMPISPSTKNGTLYVPPPGVLMPTLVVMLLRKGSVSRPRMNVAQSPNIYPLADSSALRPAPALQSSITQ